jgi:DNA-binding LytR/AlgR family response regulator
VTPLRVLAVDDEALALRRLEIALSHIPGVTLVGTARSGRQALDQLAAQPVDVLLLDIRMAGIDGFGVLDHLSPETRPAIIFVTAFDAFATRAFDVAAVDYILKPVEFDRLSAALDRARAQIGQGRTVTEIAELRAIIADLRSHRDPVASASRHESELWVEHRGAFLRIPVAGIRWVEADRDYIHIHAADQRYLLRETIGSMAERLDPAQFVRVRRSAIVRIDEIASIRRLAYGEVRVTLRDGTEVRVGRTYLAAIRQLLRPTAEA